MYSINEKTKTDSNNSKYFNSGIQEDIFIDELRYEKIDSGFEILVVTIKNSSGTTLSQKYFEPKMNQWVDTEEKLQLEIEKFCGIMKNIASIFLGPNYELANKKTFKEFVEAVLKDIGKKYEGVELRSKLTFSKKGYIQLPQQSPVFEAIIVKPTKFFIGKKDILERPVKPDAEIQEDIKKNANPSDELLF